MAPMLAASTSRGLGVLASDQRGKCERRACAMTGRVWLDESPEDGQGFRVWVDGRVVAVTLQAGDEPTEEDRTIANGIVAGIDDALQLAGRW